MCVPGIDILFVLSTSFCRFRVFVCLQLMHFVCYLPLFEGLGTSSREVITFFTYFHNI